MTETYDGNGNSLVTDADIQSNSHSDSDFMKETIEAKEDPEQEEQIIKDGAYYSSENAEAAVEKGILIAPTSLAGSPTNPLYADFELSVDGQSVIACPNGCEPESQVYHEETGKIDAKFSHKCCDGCPLRGQCPGKDQKKSVKVSISPQTVDRASLQESLGTEEHGQMARECSGGHTIHIQKEIWN